MNSGTSSLESTRHLLERARGGDTNAREALFARLLPPLQRWARGRVPLPARSLLDTDDLVQETMMASLNHVPSFDPAHSGALLGYLRQGALNKIRDALRRARARNLKEGTAGRVPDPRPTPVEEVVGREQIAHYEAALSRLHANDREAVFAHVELGLSHREIAAMLGKNSPDAARMAIKRALVRLAKEMESGGH